MLGTVPNVAIVRKELAVEFGQGADRPCQGECRESGVRQPGQRRHAASHRQHVHDQTGTEMVHVPYRGETLVLQDMLGGHVDVFFGNVAAALALGATER